MNVEKQPSRERITLIFVMGCVMISMYVLSFFIHSDTVRTDWHIHYAGAEENVFTTTETVDFQLFVEDEVGKAIDDATVRVSFHRTNSMDQMEKVFMRVEGGLYETDVLFPSQGNWIAKIEVRRGKEIYYDELVVGVQ